MFDADNFSASDEEHESADEGGLTMRALSANDDENKAPAGKKKSSSAVNSPVSVPKSSLKKESGGGGAGKNSSVPPPAKPGENAQPKSGGSPNAKRLRQRRENTITASRFHELYSLDGELLGQGAYAAVRTCVSRVTGTEYAVKIIEKRPGYMNRSRVMKEIETFNICEGHPNIVQLMEYFEEDDKFYLVFEKMKGGHLLNHIQRRVTFTEAEALQVVKDIANGLKFLHDKGIAHRDVKPENILCTSTERASPVKLCDLDLASKMTKKIPCRITTPELQSPVGSAEFLSPEVVDVFVGEAITYDKRCDLWSLGVILYILLCGYPPFYGECSRENCGWDRGLPCQDCQECLFTKIQKGEYHFYEEDWWAIDGGAKDLISHLLVKDKNARYTADDVLRHPWVRGERKASQSPLATPGVLLRNDSVRDCKQMDENFNAFSRVMMRDRSTDLTAASALHDANARRATLAAVSPLPHLMSAARLSSGRCTPTTPRDSCGGAASAAAADSAALQAADSSEDVFVKA